MNTIHPCPNPVPRYMASPSIPDEPKLTPGQEEALRLVTEGVSICLTGAGGSGKSYIIKHILQTLGLDKTIAVTALTGIAGTHIDGLTLHSWSGIPTRQTNKERILKVLQDDVETVDRWKTTDLLVIDEISMMSAELFNKLDYIGRHIRDVLDKPFGGLQLILSGDFCQLPPIGHNDRYCFESTNWSQAIYRTIHLHQIMRQSDPDLQRVLNEVRLGQITSVGKELLNSRLLKNISSSCSSGDSVDSVGQNGGVRPTLVYPHKAKVAEINKRELDRVLALGETEVSYSFKDTMAVKPQFKSRLSLCSRDKKGLEDYLDKHCTAEKELLLTIGCQVMLLVNLDLKKGLVNGATGIVVDFEVDPETPGSAPFPVVKFHNGLQQTIRKFTWKPEHPKYALKRTQVPLMLSWAITVHRAQGATLPCVIADLREAFSPGMAYVILSRIQSLEGLYLEGIRYSKIKCDPRVKKFYADVCKNIGP